MLDCQPERPLEPVFDGLDALGGTARIRAVLLTKIDHVFRERVEEVKQLAIARLVAERQDG